MRQSVGETKPGQGEKRTGRVEFTFGQSHSRRGARVQPDLLGSVESRQQRKLGRTRSLGQRRRDVEHAHVAEHLFRGATIGHQGDDAALTAAGTLPKVATPGSVQQRNLVTTVVAGFALVLLLSTSLVTQLTAGGMSVRNVDKTPFQIALRNAGFYAEWHKKFGDDVWVLLEKYTGKLS